MIKIYITIMPVILGGILNMVFTKTNFYKRHCTPIDLHKNFIDNKRIFGDNKTYIGFVSMIIFTSLVQFFWGMVCKIPCFYANNELYIINENTHIFNLYTGALLGFAYMICELPNSFIKRRISIKPGKTSGGIIGVVFFVVDQFDSVIGTGIVILVLTQISAMRVAVYILVGGFTHIVVNLCLYALKIRKNI